MFMVLFLSSVSESNKRLWLIHASCETSYWWLQMARLWIYCSDNWQCNTIMWIMHFSESCLPVTLVICLFFVQMHYSCNCERSFFVQTFVQYYKTWLFMVMYKLFSYSGVQYVLSGEGILMLPLNVILYLLLECNGCNCQYERK